MTSLDDRDDASRFGRKRVERDRGHQFHKENSPAALLTVCSAEDNMTEIIVRLIDEKGFVTVVGGSGAEAERGRKAHCFFGAQDGRYAVVLERLVSGDSKVRSRKPVQGTVQFNKCKVVLQLKDFRVGVSSRAGDEHVVFSNRCTGQGTIWRVGEVLFEKRRRARWVNACSMTFGSTLEYLAVSYRARKRSADADISLQSPSTQETLPSPDVDLGPPILPKRLRQEGPSHHLTVRTHPSTLDPPTERPPAYCSNPRPITSITPLPLSSRGNPFTTPAIATPHMPVSARSLLWPDGLVTPRRPVNEIPAPGHGAGRPGEESGAVATGAQLPRGGVGAGVAAGMSAWAPSPRWGEGLFSPSGGDGIHLRSMVWSPRDGVFQSDGRSGVAGPPRSAADGGQNVPKT